VPGLVIAYSSFTLCDLNSSQEPWAFAKG